MLRAVRVLPGILLRDLSPISCGMAPQEFQVLHLRFLEGRQSCGGDHYAGLDPDGEDYVDTLREHRHNIHHLMRFAYLWGAFAESIVEDLERERQGIAALTAYVIAVRDGRYPERLEEARRDKA